MLNGIQQLFKAKIFKILSYLLDHGIWALGVLTRGRFPLILSTCAIITDKSGRYLVQDRADKKGYCFPGGLTKKGEALADSIIREVKEETGYEIGQLEFVMIKDANSVYPYTALAVYRGKVIGGSLKDSWEGKALWLSSKKLHGKMAFDEEELLKIYEARF